MFVNKICAEYQFLIKLQFRNPEDHNNWNSTSHQGHFDLILPTQTWVKKYYSWFILQFPTARHHELSKKPFKKDSNSIQLFFLRNLGGWRAGIVKNTWHLCWVPRKQSGAVAKSVSWIINIGKKTKLSATVGPMDLWFCICILMHKS